MNERGEGDELKEYGLMFGRQDAGEGGKTGLVMERPHNSYGTHVERGDFYQTPETTKP